MSGPRPLGERRRGGRTPPSTRSAERDARDLEFVSRGPVGLERLREALEPGVRLAASPEHVVTHQWLDTFDRRLRRAGLSLELATEADPSRPTLL
ncbi:MAG: hypothetical protein WBU92_11490, partial [Candidatus Dormiibacterota bacterium]